MIIYKITNKINGKVYIGQTVVDLSARWRQHVRAKDNAKIHRAIRKYGASVFTVEPIDVACSIEELNQKEKFWIQKFDSIKQGYNMTEGGRSGAVDLKRTDETKRRIAEAITGGKHWHAKKVRNVDTGEIFDTVSAAASKYNTEKSNIIGCCKHRPHYYTCKGCRWEYVTDDNEAV